MKRTATKLMSVALMLALAATILMPGHFQSADMEPPTGFDHESLTTQLEAEPIAEGYGDLKPWTPPSRRPPPQV